MAVRRMQSKRKPTRNPKHVHVIVTHRFDDDFIEMITQRHLAIERALNTVARSLRTINEKVNEIMTISQQMRDTLKEIDEETTAIAKKLEDTSTSVKPGMSEDEVAEVQGQLSGISSRLKVLAANPENPIPEPIG